jgi:hypothetical protein
VRISAGKGQMMTLRICAAALIASTVWAGTAAAQTRDVGEVFADFEDICLSYADQGYSIDIRASIDRLGFQFLGKNGDGEDSFNSNILQLIIGDKGCAFGMPNLPFDRMLEWTKQWVEYQGFTYTRMTQNPSGGEYWIWSGQDFQVALSEEEFPDHTPMSALILTRE